MADKKIKDEKKTNDDGKKTPKTDRHDIAKGWNPLAWMHEMEKRMMDEFRNVGFGSWLGREGDFGAGSDEIEGKDFTKGSNAKSAGWSYHYQTGMDAPEIRTWGGVKQEDIEKYLAARDAPSLGPAKKDGDAGKESKEGEPDVEIEGTNADEWDPFQMFSDMFEGFSRPFFRNMGKFLGQSEPQLGAVDASHMEPTTEAPATPAATEEATPQTAQEETKATPQTGKPVIEPFADVIYDKDGNLVGTLEIPGATEEALKVTVDGDIIRVEAEGPLRKYHKEIQASFKLDPTKVTCHLINGICELRAEKA